MSRINILNATAEDFKLEVFASAPASGSSGDHADGRIVKYGTHLYIWHDASGTWIKFGNASDISSLETRLSVQEAECDSDVSSLESKDSSLETRISSEEIARAAAVSSEASRAAAAEGSLETRLSVEESARVVDVDAEESRALVAEGSVETRLSVEESARVVAVDSLEARASGEEASLTTRVSSEESVEASAEASLNTRMAAEESVRLANDGSLETAIAAEGSSRAAADTSLETRLSTEENRVDAILNASSADKDSFAEIVSFINSVDVAHDSQTSSEISSIDSSIAAEESSRLAADNSLETRLSVEESNEAAAEASLNVRMSIEESNEASAEASLDLRMSSEESARLAADNSVASEISDAASARASGDSSLTTRLSSEESARAAGDNSLETVLASAELARGNADSSLETRLSSEEVNRAAAVSSEASSRTAADDSLELRLSVEESTRAVEDASVQALVSAEESSRLAADNSLETRLSIEESVEAAADASLETRISSEESAMAAADDSIESRFSGEISTEKSRIDAILDGASADKDTFVEIVSFITAVDTESDDALASYVTSIDSAISAEESAEAAAEGSLNTALSSEISAQESAVDSLEAAHSALISAQDSSIVVLEGNEESRHLRVDFTNQTSFSVAAVDLPSGFSVGNGMVQIFHEVAADTYRHLVAPVSYNPTTGAMSFDLGSTAKDGFAVFYSFAGDETAVTEVTEYSDIYITGVSLSNIYDTYNTDNDIVFDIEGMNSSNFQKYFDITTQTTLHYPGSSHINDTFMTDTALVNQVSYLRSLSASYNSDYSKLTLSWTTPNDSSWVPSGSQSYWDINIALNGRGTSNQNAMNLKIRFDKSTGNLDTTYGLGYNPPSSTNKFLLNPYMPASGTATSFARSWSSSGNKYYKFEGLFDIQGRQTFNDTSNAFENWEQRYSSPYWMNYLNLLNFNHASRYTSGGNIYVTHYSSVSNTHDLYDEITENATSNIETSSAHGRFYPTNASGKPTEAWSWFTYNLEPDLNSDITLYHIASHTSGTQIEAYSGIAVNNDYKIVFSFGGSRTASDFSWKMYVNTTTDTGTVTWVELERFYPFGSNV